MILKSFIVLKKKESKQTSFSLANKNLVAENRPCHTFVKCINLGGKDQQEADQHLLPGKVAKNLNSSSCSAGRSLQHHEGIVKLH